MNTPSSRMVGVSNTAASSRSLSSRRRVRDGWVCGWGSATTTAPFVPPAIGFFTSLPLVDLLELGLGPLHRILGLRTLHGLRVHVDDDVLRVGLGGLGRGRPRVAERAGEARRLPEQLQR